MKHTTCLNVLINDLPVGTLAESPDHKIYFSYHQEWLQHGFDLSPHTLRFASEVQLAQSNLFNGLHGVFADSLPDAWGMMLINRVLKQRFGWYWQEISQLDYLACIGNRAMGALRYIPEIHASNQKECIDLDEMASLIDAVFCDEESVVLDKLLVHGGSPGGARPKILVARNKTEGVCLSGQDRIPPGFSHWMVKFKAPSEHDPEDIGNIEQAYAEMAKAAGVEMPETDLVQTRKGLVCFAVKRFDRTPVGERLHMLSLSGWAYADHRTPCLDYDEVLKAVRILTKNENDVEKAFRLAVFNVASVNKDDHAKNFAFLCQHGQWSFAPAFDLTFSNVLSEHTTSTMGKGNPKRSEFIKLAAKHRLARSHAEGTIDQVLSATASWRKFAGAWGVSELSSKRIDSALKQVSKRLAKDNWDCAAIKKVR